MENSVHSVLNCMAADFAEPLGYLIAGIFPALILTGAAALVRWYLYGRNWRNKLGPIFLLVLYGYVVARQAFFSRVPGSRTGVDLEILTTWGESPQSHAYVLENIIMFLPFGFLIPILWDPARRIQICVGLGIGASLSIEILQFLTKRGHFQTDDILMNGVGTLLGWCVFAYYLRRRRRSGNGLSFRAAGRSAVTPRGRKFGL